MITGPYEVLGDKLVATHHWQRRANSPSLLEIERDGLDPEMAGKPGKVIERGSNRTTIAEFEGWVPEETKKALAAAMNDTIFEQARRAVQHQLDAAIKRTDEGGCDGGDVAECEAIQEELMRLVWGEQG